MSGETTASALGQIAFATYYERTAGRPLVMPDSWDMQAADVRADWEAAGAAVAARVVETTAEDFDRAAEEIALRYALVEQMGHRATYASVREVTFCGKPVLEVTGLRTGAVTLVAPESLYQVTWLTESDARARANPWTAVALPAANPNPWGDYGADDYPHNADPDEGKDDGMSAAEREESDDLHGFALDAADEARDLEREAEADA